MVGPLTTSTHAVMAKVPRLQSSGSENISLGDIQVIHGVSRLRPHPKHYVVYVRIFVRQKLLKCAIYIYIYIYIYRKSASRFSRGTVLNTLKQSRINIMRGKKGRNYIS